MKIASPKPGSTIRYTMQLDIPVALDGVIAPPGSLVDVSDAQVALIIMRSLGMAASPLEVEGSRVLAIRPPAVIEWAGEGMTPRQRKTWRPSRLGGNRLASRGSVRLDAGASIIEQVRNIVR